MHQVRYFLAVAEHLNFTRAAERLHVAQPSLTRAIQKLEEELDGPLFRRERSNTHLTELGRMMLPHLQASLASAEAAKQQARSFHKRETGQLRVGISGGVSAAVVAPLLAAVSGDIADLELLVETSPSAAVEERLITGEVDVAVLAPVGDAPERFDLHPILEDGLVVAFRPGHRFDGLDELTLEALDGEPLVVRSACEHEGAIAVATQARGLIRVERHRSAEDAWLCEMVGAGGGCLVAPEGTVRVLSLLAAPWILLLKSEKDPNNGRLGR
jgi:DNA-binding transcriptional LysR family regulator